MGFGIKQIRRRFNKMANRYKNQNYGRGYEGRRSYGGRYSETGRGESGYDREENFYSGRQSGRGSRLNESEGDFRSYNRDYDEDYTTGSYQGGRGYGRGNDYDRESYYSSANEHGGNYGGYSERGDFRRGYREYSGNYPESESGYDLERDEERGWLDKASDEVSSWFGDEDAERRRRLDARRQGSYRGRGPKNYTRSDERIREDINDRLTDSDYLDASGIEVGVVNCEVILTGTVDSRYAKRLAEDIAEDVSGVTNVENRLRVDQSFYGQGSGSSFTGAAENTGTIGKTNTAMGMPDRVSGMTGATSIGASETDNTTTTGKSRGNTA